MNTAYTRNDQIQQPRRYKIMRKLTFIIISCLAALVLGSPTTTMAQKTIELSDEQVENIVRLSYPYVAMYNVNNKFAMDDSSPMSTGGWPTACACAGLGLLTETPGKNSISASALPS